MFGLFAVFAVSDSARGDPNPGLKAVADSSTDIAVLEVLDSKPHRAVEGARDTAQFKVVRPLKGPLQPGDKIGVYYHLLWADTEKWVLEKPKFEKGNRYTVFLVKGQGYTLTDQWLAVLPEHPDLDKDVAHDLNEVGDLWSDYWRKQHKGPLTSRRRIEILPDAKVSRTKDRLTLSVKIVNHSAQEITTRLAHEWHGGEWLSTDLYASATPVTAKQAPNHSDIGAGHATHQLGADVARTLFDSCSRKAPLLQAGCRLVGGRDDRNGRAGALLDGTHGRAI
jgi:hypothetical protein